MQRNRLDNVVLFAILLCNVIAYLAYHRLGWRISAGDHTYTPAALPPERDRTHVGIGRRTTRYLFCSSDAYQQALSRLTL